MRLKGEQRVTKNIFKEYIDACELVKETEKKIKELEKQKEFVSQDSVKGSNPEYPYQEQHFRIRGIDNRCIDNHALRSEERTLNERKKRAETVKHEVEQYMNTLPLRIQRIIQYKYFDGLTWEQTAKKIGRGTGESVRKEIYNFMREK